MKTTPKSEKELQEALLLPDGEYDFEVIDAKDKTSKNSGAEMIELKLKVFGSDGSPRYVTDYLLDAMAFKLRHFADTAGLMAEYEAGGFAAESCKGRTGRVKLKTEAARGDFQAKNAVRDYVKAGVTPAVAPAPNRAPAPAASGTDEPPF